MIERNPYERVDFNECVRVLSNTHEHITKQDSLEHVWNKGVRNVNSSHYMPSAPIIFNPDYQAEYLDFNTAEDLTIVTKQTPKRNFHDFTDVSGNEVSIADIVSIPTAERVNIIGYDYMLHSNYLGSTYGEPGWNDIEGVDPQTIVTWRRAHKFQTAEQLFQGIRNNMPFGRVFGTLNHPRDNDEPYESVVDFIKKSNGLIHAVETYSSVKASESHKKRFVETYDKLLKDGFRLWCVCVTDWPHLDIERDYGCNQLLLPSNYNQLSYIEKQNAILDCYLSGEYFGCGLGTLQVENYSIIEDTISISFNRNCHLSAVIDGNNLDKGTGTNFSQKIDSAKNYIRFYAEAQDGDFVFTNPLFFIYNKQDSITKKMLVL